MNSKIIDARGQLCPKPIILTKKAINDPNIPNEFFLLIDNETSKENVERFLKDNGILHQTYQKENYFQISVSKTGEKADSSSEAYCSISTTKKLTADHIMAITNDKMGSGSDELGKILIQGFMNTIKEVSPLPQKIIFYNNGVKLTLKDSPVIDSLKELEKLGVMIQICGTCVDYYKVKDKIGCGKISNMYDITDSLTKATHIISP